MRLILHIIILVFLTILTQIGGIIYLLSILFIRKKSKKKGVKQIGVFVFSYLVITFLIVPYIAPTFGREKVKESDLIEANTFITKLLNRNYVKPELNRILQKTSIALNDKYSGIKLIYLDANFPFINDFPLLPHLSHNDGKKIDLSFIYNDKDGKLSNKKPSMSGYGVYSEPTTKEYNQTSACKEKGYWQYDFSKYLTFGNTNKGISLSEKATKSLLLELVKQPNIEKIFIEPHLKNRMNLKHTKIRFHGCKAVRHDDHIHIQTR